MMLGIKQWILLVSLSIAITLSRSEPIPHPQFVISGSELPSEGEEEALRLWQKFCAGNANQDAKQDGALFVYCKATAENVDGDQLKLEVQHEVKEPQIRKENPKPVTKEVQIKKEAPKTEVKEPQKQKEQEVKEEIPTGRSLSRIRIRNGRRYYYARKNTVGRPQQRQQFNSQSSTSESPVEISTQTSVSVSQNHTVTVVNQKDPTISIIQRKRKRIRQNSELNNRNKS